MDFELYGSQNSKVLLEQSSLQSKDDWNIASDGSMDNNDEYFGWTDSLKIDEEKFDEDNGKLTSRKRKLSSGLNEGGKIKNGAAFKSMKDPLACETTNKEFVAGKASTQNGIHFICNIKSYFLSHLKNY